MAKNHPLVDDIKHNTEFVLFMLDSPITFHRAYIPLTGRVTAALMLSWSVQVAEETTDPDGWFAKTNDEWSAEIGLSKDELSTARKRLVELGLLEVRTTAQTLTGQMKRCNEYRVNFAALGSALHEQADRLAGGCH